MKCLILSFFAALLAYSLFFDDEKGRADTTVFPMDSAIHENKAGMNDSVLISNPTIKMPLNTFSKVD